MDTKTNKLIVGKNSEKYEMSASTQWWLKLLSRPHEPPGKPRAVGWAAKCKEQSMGLGVEFEDYIYHVLNV